MTSKRNLSLYLNQEMKKALTLRPDGMGDGVFMQSMISRHYHAMTILAPTIMDELDQWKELYAIWKETGATPFASRELNSLQAVLEDMAQDGSSELKKMVRELQVEGIPESAGLVASCLECLPQLIEQFGEK